MTSTRMQRIQRDLRLKEMIADHFWEHMDEHICTVSNWEKNCATYHVYLVFGVKIKWEELLYIVWNN